MTDIPQGKTSMLHQLEGEGFYLAQFKTPDLAIFSYYLESNGQVYLIDPTYDVAAYRTMEQKRNGKIVGILLTHYHADYLAGHTEFNVEIQMGPKSKRDNSNLKIVEKSDHSVITLGSISITVIHTPGHTLESTCYLLTDTKGKQTCLFTGDTIFLNQIGRPDLAVSETTTKQDLAKMLFHSLNKIKKQVDPSVRIYPAHGSGSACGKKIGEGNFCKLETQIQKNYAFKIGNEEQFVQAILANMPKPPSYFAYVAKLNQAQPQSRFDDHLKQSDRSLSIDQFKNLLDQGCTIIDTRHQFGGKTIKGSYMMTENGMIAAWIGALLKPEINILLICKNDSGRDQIQRLFRIGFFNIKGYNGFTIDEWKQKGLPIWQPKCVNAKTMSETPGITNLDVRNLQQWKETGVIENSKLIPLFDIPNHLTELKDLPNLYINCKTGGRARLASSILAQHDIPSVIVAQKFVDFHKAGIKIVEYK